MTLWHQSGCSLRRHVFTGIMSFGCPVDLLVRNVQKLSGLMESHTSKACTTSENSRSTNVFLCGYGTPQPGQHMILESHCQCSLGPESSTRCLVRLSAFLRWTKRIVKKLRVERFGTHPGPTIDHPSLKACRTVAFPKSSETHAAESYYWDTRVRPRVAHVVHGFATQPQLASSSGKQKPPTMARTGHCL